MRKNSGPQQRSAPPSPFIPVFKTDPALIWHPQERPAGVLDSPYRQLLAAIPDAVFLETTEGKILDCNAVACERYGYSSSELLTLTTTALLSPSQPPGSSQGSLWIEGLGHRQDGSTFPVQFKRTLISALHPPQILTIVQDLTTKKRMDEEIQRLKTADLEEKKNSFLERIQKQRTALMQLSSHPALTEGRLAAWFTIVCKTAAETLEVGRVSLWQFSTDGLILHCRDLYQGTLADPWIGMEIAMEDSPGYFAALRSGQTLDISHIEQDPRTNELNESYWQRLGIQAALIAPIRQPSKVIGFISYENLDTPRTWTPDERMFGSQLADLIAQAYLNADLRRRADELAAITRVNREITSNPDLQSVLDSIALNAALLSHSDASGVFLMQPDGKLKFVAGYGIHPAFLDLLHTEDIHIGQGVMERALARRAPIQITDIQIPPMAIYPASYAAIEWIHALLAVPMGQGEEIPGGIILWHRQSRHFTDQEVDFIQALAQQCVNAVQNAQLFTAERQTRRRTEALYKVSRDISSSVEEEPLIHAILESISQTLSYDYITLSTVDEENNTIMVRHGIWYGEFDRFPEWVELAHYPLDHSDIMADIYRSGKTEIIDAWDPRFNREIWDKFNHEKLLRIFTPIKMRQKIIGVIEAGYEKARRTAIEEEEVQMLMAFADQAAVALENARLFTSLMQEKGRLELLYRLSRRIPERLALQEVARRALSELCNGLPGTQGYILGYDCDDGDLQLMAAFGYTGYPQIDMICPLPTRAPAASQSDQTETSPPLDLLRDPRWGISYTLDDDTRSSLAVPLISNNQNLGVLLLGSREPNFFHEQHRRLVESAAMTTAIALANARLFEETRRRAFEQETVSRIARACNALEVQAAIPILVEGLRSLTGCEQVIFSLLDETRMHCRFIPIPGIPDSLLSHGITFALNALNNPLDRPNMQPRIISNLDKNAATFQEQILITAGFHSLIILPLLAGDEILGQLHIAGRPADLFRKEQLPSLHQIADVLAGALEKSRFFQAEQRRRQEAETLRETALALAAAAVDRKEVIERILAQLQTVIPYDSASVQLLREGYFEIVGGRGFPNLPELLGVRFSLTGDNPNAEIHRLRTPFIVAQASNNYTEFQKEPHIQGRIYSWMGVPILIGERLIGMIALDKHEIGFYTPEHARLAQAFAAQAAVALENSRLFQETRQRAEALAALHESAVAMASILSVDMVLHTLAERIGTLLDTTSVYINDWDGEQDYARMLTHWKNAQAPTTERLSHPGLIYKLKDYPMLLQGLTTRQPQVLQSAGLQSESTEWIEAQQFGWQTRMTVPLVVRDSIIGYIELWESRAPRCFTAAEIQLAQTMAADAAVALEHARLFQAERKQREIAQALSEAAAAVSSTLDKEVALGHILEQVARVVPAVGFNIMQIDEQNKIHLTRWYGYAENPPALQPFYLNDYPLLQKIYGTGQPILLKITATSPDWKPFPGIPETGSYLGVPIQASRITVGFLNIDGLSDLDPGDLPHLEAFANQAATAIQNAALFKELRDYTELLEQRVQERTAQIQVQYARQEAVLSSTTDGIIVADREGKILLANPVAQAWLTRQLSPEDAGQLSRAVAEMAPRAAQRPDKVLELKGLDLQLNAAPISEPGADGAVAVVAVHDVSFLKALDRIKSQFISNISHELRTPITVIQLYTALLRQAPPDRWALYLDILEQETKRQARLVEDILQISRIEAGRLEITPAPTSLNHLARLVYNSHQPLAQTQSLFLDLNLEEPDPIAWVDPDRAVQILNNLVENALRYTMIGGKIQITTYLQQSEDRIWACFAVSDTGIGIPAEELNHIFERFYRGEDAREKQIPGTGLGLSIVKDLVELHGGRVLVESSPGSGSTFQIWLPQGDSK